MFDYVMDRPIKKGRYIEDQMVKILEADQSTLPQGAKKHGVIVQLRSSISGRGPSASTDRRATCGPTPALAPSYSGSTSGASTRRSSSPASLSSTGSIRASTAKIRDECLHRQGSR
jgi:hypothetical protein